MAPLRGSSGLAFFRVRSAPPPRRKTNAAARGPRYGDLQAWLAGVLARIAGSVKTQVGRPASAATAFAWIMEAARRPPVLGCRGASARRQGRTRERQTRPDSARFRCGSTSRQRATLPRRPSQRRQRLPADRSRSAWVATLCESDFANGGKEVTLRICIDALSDKALEVGASIFSDAPFRIRSCLRDRSTERGFRRLPNCRRRYRRR